MMSTISPLHTGHLRGLRSTLMILGRSIIMPIYLLLVCNNNVADVPRFVKSRAPARHITPLPAHIVQPRKRQHHAPSPPLYSYWFFRLYCSVIANSSLNLSSRSAFSNPWFICFRLCLSHVKSRLSSRLYLERFLLFSSMNVKTAS